MCFAFTDAKQNYYLKQKEEKYLYKEKKLMLQEVRSKIVWKKFGKFVKGKKEVMEQDTDINI